MLRNLPIEIRTSSRCVVWRLEHRAGRPTKVPYMATAPCVRAAVDDPRTWAPFADAIWCVQNGHADGVGLVLGAGNCGVDFDHVRDARTGVVADGVMQDVHALDSYTEVSPSGTGLHVLARGTLPPGRRRHGHIEMYDDKRFFTVTGRHVVGTPWTLEERTAALAVLHRRVFSTETSCISSARFVQPSADGDDARLVERAHAARNGQKFGRLWAGDSAGYASRSEADLALCNYLAFWTGHDRVRIDRLFRASGLMRLKWDDPRGDETYGSRTISRALRGTMQRTGSAAGATIRED